MIFSRVRGFVLACAVAAVVLAVPSQSKGFDCFSRLFGWCCGGSQTTYRAPYVPTAYAPAYAPTYSAYAPTYSAYTPRTCCYVPQTCYRTVYQQIPVTTCQLTTRRRCFFGPPVTTYRPVTTWVSRPVLVPYTTYQVVCSNPCDPCGTPCGGISPCAGGAGGSVSSGCAPCGTGTINGSIAPYPGLLDMTPKLEKSSSAAAENQKTFEEPKSQESKKPIELLKPIPNPNTSSAPGLKLIQPENRTTLLPVRQATYYHPVSLPPKPAAPQVQIGVWRASTD